MEKIDDIGIWSANETVYKAGTPPEFNYLVIEGDVKVNAPNGHYLGEVGEGELFGEASFILDTKRSTTVIAGSKGLKAKLIPPKQILQKLEKDLFLKALIRKLEKRLDSSNFETVQRSVKIKEAVELLHDLTSEIERFGANIKQDHPDAAILVTKLLNITESIKKIKNNLNFI
jgi:CRP-like cAMP-binding protein